MANYGKQWPWIASSCHFERMADENDSADTYSPARQTTRDSNEGRGGAAGSLRLCEFFMAHMRLIEIGMLDGGCWMENGGGAGAGAAGAWQETSRGQWQFMRLSVALNVQ